MSPRQAQALLSPLRALLAKASSFDPAGATTILLCARADIAKLPQELRPEAQAMLTQASAVLEGLCEPKALAGPLRQPEANTTIKLGPTGTTALVTTAYGNTIEVSDMADLLRVLRITAPAPRRGARIAPHGKITLSEWNRVEKSLPNGKTTTFGTGKEQAPVKVKKLTPGPNGKQIATLADLDF